MPPPPPRVGGGGARGAAHPGSGAAPRAPPPPAPAPAAGAHLRDVAQVLLYVADARDIPTIDAVYREFFAAPYPNRACVAVRGFAHPDMRIELVAHVALGRAAPAG
ncbi:RidA family protein [Burkholderia pseudomallei]|uniref:RidA family protein n=1 Tax=Burkholderia pseudomallei TaxID=28450 RepID=UPI003132AD0A